MTDTHTIDVHCHWVTPECLEAMSRVDSSWTFVREETAPELFHIQINNRKSDRCAWAGLTWIVA